MEIFYNCKSFYSSNVPLLVIDDGRQYYQYLGSVDIIFSDSEIIAILNRKDLTMREKLLDVVFRKHNTQFKV